MKITGLGVVVCSASKRGYERKRLRANAAHHAPGAWKGQVMGKKALGQYLMYNEDKLILTREGMNLLLNLLKGLID